MNLLTCPLWKGRDLELLGLTVAIAISVRGAPAMHDTHLDSQQPLAEVSPILTPH